MEQINILYPHLKSLDMCMSEPTKTPPRMKFVQSSSDGREGTSSPKLISSSAYKKVVVIQCKVNLILLHFHVNMSKRCILYKYIWK